MPKTLTGEELQLDDAPARDSDLFLVDGNNLAYRAYFALPEELATSEGMPTNALLGFTNMLFKLLTDYRPKGVAVAWDTRPVERMEQHEGYKADRRPMADLLREQFPYFRPIVEAFGYRNLEFEGWEADDVIATLATRADQAGVKTTVVSTDRDAFQLVTENVTLMMTPRGVADVNVYTPERVEARLGITPEQIPDFIGLKGDSSDNIPGIPGIGDKTASQLIQQYGSLEGVIEHVEELTPARRKNISENADQAKVSKELATMRRDLELDCDPAELVLSPPDRSRLKEMFRQFEFRGLLGRVDDLDATVPAAPMVLEGVQVPWREGELPESGAIAAENGRVAVATEEGVVVGPRPARLDGRFVAHDAKAQRVEPAEDTLLAAYLIDPGRATYELDDLAAEYGIELVPDPLGRRGHLRARPPRGRHASARRAPRLPPEGARRGRALPRDRAPAHPGARRHGGHRRQDRRVPHGGDHCPARRPGRGARAEGLRARRRGVHPRLHPAGRQDPLREARAHAGPQGQDRLLDGYPRPPQDPARARDRRRDRGVEGVLEARQHLPRTAADIDLGARQAAPHDVQPGRRLDGKALDDEPEPPGDPDPHRARQGDPLGVRRRAGPPPPLRGLLPDRVADPRARLRRAQAPRGVRTRRRHPHRHGRRGAGQGSGRADDGRPLDGEDDQLRDRLRDLVVRPLREPRDPPRAGAGADRHLPRALPARPGLHPAHDRAGNPGRLHDEPARTAASSAGAARLEQADPLAGRAPRRQLRHAGLERGHHQEGDDLDPPPAAERGARSEARAPGPRRAAARGAGGGGVTGEGARPRGDVRRL